MIEKEGEELDTFLERWASNKYAELSASPTAHGGGGPAGLGVNEETGRFEKLDGFYVFRRSKKVFGSVDKKDFRCKGLLDCRRPQAGGWLQE